MPGHSLLQCNLRSWFQHTGVNMVLSEQGPSHSPQQLLQLATFSLLLSAPSDFPLADKAPSAPTDTVLSRGCCPSALSLARLHGPQPLLRFRTCLFLVFLLVVLPVPSSPLLAGSAHFLHLNAWSSVSLMGKSLLLMGNRCLGIPSCKAQQCCCREMSPSAPGSTATVGKGRQWGDKNSSITDVKLSKFVQKPLHSGCCHTHGALLGYSTDMLLKACCGLRAEYPTKSSKQKEPEVTLCVICCPKHLERPCKKAVRASKSSRLC